MITAGDEVPGFTVPVHRALSEPILLGGAPRAIAILNGTLAGAVGLGLRLWLIGHFAAVWAAKRDPLFVGVARTPGLPTSRLGRRWPVPASRSTRTAASSTPRGFGVPIRIPPCPLN